MNKIVTKIIKQLLIADYDTSDLEGMMAYVSNPSLFKSEKFFEYRTFPKDGQYIIDSFPMKPKKESIGIMLQGFIHDMTFLIQTIELYKRLFYSPVILVSTWIDQDTSVLDEQFGNGIIIVKNKYPEKTGFFNLNKMITSTRNGLAEMKKRSVEYVIRTRVDQRIQYENIDDYLIALLDHHSSTSQYQKNRIIITNMMTMKYNPFHFEDMFQFAHIDDLITYWNVELSTRTMDAQTFQNICENISIKEEQQIDNSEVFLGIQYAKKILADDYKYSYSAYYQLLRDNFIVIDIGMLGLTWIKQQKFLQFLTSNNEKEKLSQSLTHKDWYLLKSGMIDIDRFEKDHNSYLDKNRLGTFQN